MKSLLAIFLILAVTPLQAAEEDRKGLEKNLRKVELKIRETRLRLLQEDEELKEINERILGLQRLLTQKLDARSEMKVLHKEKAALKKDLAAARL